MQNKTDKSEFAGKSLLSLLEDIASEEHITSYAPNRRVVHEFENSYKILIIRSGILKVGVGHKDKEVVINFIVPGDIIGASLFYNNNTDYYIDTITEVSAYVWELERAYELIDLIPELKSLMLTMNNFWMNGLVSRLRELNIKNPVERVIDWIKTYHNNERFTSIKLWESIPSSEMANYCSISESRFNSIIIKLRKQNDFKQADNFTFK